MQSAASEPVAFLGSPLALYWSIQTSQNGFYIWVESHVVCIVRLSLLTAAVRPVTLVSVTKVHLLPDRETVTEMWWDFFFGGGDSCDLYSHCSLQTHASLMWCLHTWRFRRCLQWKGVTTCVEVPVCMHFCASWWRTVECRPNSTNYYIRH